MRKIAATYVFPGNRPPIKNGILICENDGTVIEILEPGGDLREQHGLEFYAGILAPGFVNVHCHLELSHLGGKIEEKSGIGGFIGKINQLRNEDGDNVEKAMEIADRKMWAAGIAVVGDVSNSILTVSTKRKSKIYYHTFIEAFGFHPSRAELAFDRAKFVQARFAEHGLVNSIVPHSPYSVSQTLFNKIAKNAKAEKSILSLHNQESEGEAEFYKLGTGPIAHHLQSNLGIDISHWKPGGKSSLQTILQYLPPENPLILVHNTFIAREDLHKLKTMRVLKNTYFALCPNSNLYIENQLPPVTIFMDEKLNVCLGTDSLASNHQLSIVAEMITLQQNFRAIDLNELIRWATINGAKALNVDDVFGSFEKGKKPGVNLISGIDFRTMKLTEKSKVKRLL